MNGFIFLCFMLGFAPVSFAITFVNKTQENVEFEVKSVQLNKREIIRVSANSALEILNIGEKYGQYHCKEGSRDTWSIKVASRHRTLLCQNMFAKQVAECNHERSTTVTLNKNGCTVSSMRTTL